MFIILVGPFTFDARLTLDGLMTLIAGVIAFVAVWWQIKSSREQVEKQLQSDLKAREEEQRRQRLAVARALLFEIDEFYARYLREPWKKLESFDPVSDKPLGVLSVGSNPFPVYYGNTARLGEFHEETSSDVVRFYVQAEAYVSMIRDYKSSLDSELAREKSISAGSEPRILLAFMKNAIPELTNLTYLVCQKLCVVAMVAFESLTIAGAAEKPR